MRRLFAKSPPADPLQHLRETVIAPRPFGSGAVVSGIWFHTDSAAEITGTWSSPAGRMLEVETSVHVPGAWCALHLRLGVNPAACAYLGFVARSVAARAMATRACIRSGDAAGFHDQFFARDILSQPGQSEHSDLLVPAQCPEMPRQAAWHELVLFLPSHRSITWALHDLRLIAL